MALQITLVKTPAAISMTKTSHLFDQRGGTLGRGDVNLWVLPDPEKFLSACHCELVFDASGYFLLDLSTNGTFFNGAFEPIGKGSRVALAHGDFFDVGEYRFSVGIVENQSFGQLHTPSTIFPATSNDGFELAATPVPLSPFGDAELSPSGFSLGLSESQDPLAAFDKATHTKAPDIFGGNIPQVPSPSAAGSHKVAPSVLLDVTPSMDQAISWPSSNRQSLIPEDWEDDVGSPANSFSFDDPFASSPFPEAPPTRQFVQEADDFTSQAHLEPLMDIVSSPQGAVGLQPAQYPLQETAETAAIVDAQVAKNPVPSPTSKENSSEQVPVSASGGSDILIRAMGLNPDVLSAEEVNDISEKVGNLMREITAGMMQVLRSRTSIKNEFRMNVTTIQPIENNPLKFSVGVDEAMENMFLKKTNAYKKPAEAFREGFQEIGEHQIAMIAGVRHGFEKMMDRFNPENLETQFNKQIKGIIIPGMQKAKHWTSYKDQYQNYSDNMESSFQHLFGSDFVTAYEDQLRKLIAARKKNK